MDTPLTPDSNISVVLNVRQGDLVTADGLPKVAKIYWDALGDGTIDDSTTGTSIFTWIWQTQVPSTIRGQKRVVIARAKDKNNIWSYPETLSLQFGPTMMGVWEFDDKTTAAYNTKDFYGNMVTWNGWPTSSFGHFKFVLTKRAKTLIQLIRGQ